MTSDYDPDLLEIGDTGDCIYLHAENCPGYCDYACNGLLGDRAASEIEARWQAGDLTDAERVIANDTRKVLRRALDKALAARSTGATLNTNASGGAAAPREGTDEGPR